MALTNPDQLKLLKGKKSKYHNTIFRDDSGITWHSKAEYRRYQLLKALESQGQIRDLKRQVSFQLDVNKQPICRYVADFVYEERHEGLWLPVVEDVKSSPTKTKEYLLKKRLMFAVHRIDIRETER